MIDASSKMSLKLSCLRACDNDVDKAGRLYDFLSEGMAEMPDFDPVRPTGFEQVKRSVSDAFEWFKGHQEDIAQGVSLFQSLRHSGGTASVASSGVPPIPDIR